MEWKRTERFKWRIAEPGYDGKAVLNETNQGFIAYITVENTEFDMELLNERDFFESRDAALQFLEEKMGQESY